MELANKKTRLNVFFYVTQCPINVFRNYLRIFQNDIV